MIKACGFWRKCAAAIGAVMGAVAATGVCPAENPIIQTIYTADPAPVVFNGTLYLYADHDEDGAKYFEMKDWHVYSTRDMVNWTDLGCRLSLKDFAWARKDAWAGQCIQRAGKYYWYVPMGIRGGGMAIGVAVGDTPLGPFKDALGRPLISDGRGDIDPTVFIDRNGQAYLGWGNPTFEYVRLNKNMVSYDQHVGDRGILRAPMTVAAFGPRQKNDRTTSYEEGPWLYERNGLYYNIFAAGPIPEHIGYAMAKSPEGPWSYGGVVMKTEGRSFTNHPAVVDYRGKTYFFYHNGALPGGGGFTRSICVEEMRFNADGSILPVKMTKAGVAPVGTLDPYQRVEAATIAWESGVRTEANGHGGVNVCNIHDGAWIEVRNVAFGAEGPVVFRARVACGSRESGEGGTIEVHVDRRDGAIIGKLQVSDTGGAWQDQTTAVKGVAGRHDLFFVFRGAKGAELFTFDDWAFAR